MDSSLGRYNLTEKIGQGGMAEVYLAKSRGAEGLEKTLVIKKIRPKHAEKEHFVEMFKQEAQIGVALNHPNIVQIYDFGRVSGTFYLAMEYVNGYDLGQLIEATRRLDETLPVGLAAFIASEVAKGLRYAHTRTDEYGEPLEIVHRDITPQNILISRDGAVKVVDFGIAKAAASEDEEPQGLKGKYSYMSPEQARGDEVGPKSDLFSLGVLLYEMLTGERLFGRGTKEETLSLVKSAVIPDIGSLNPDVPESLQSVVYDLLAKDPDDRLGVNGEAERELTRTLYDFDEIYDSMRLMRQVRRLEDEVSLSSTGRDDSTRQTSHHTAVAEQIDRTTADAGTEVASHSDSFETDQSLADSRPEISNRLPREQRQIVAVKGRVVGLLDLRRQMRQDQWTQLIQEYTRMVDSIAFKNEAIVDRVNENGFRLVLGLPLSNKNDVKRAARMSLDLVDAVGGLSRGLDGSLELAMGIATGEAMVASKRDKDSGYKWDLIDESAGLAARFADAAMPGEIIVGGKVFRRVRRSYECESIGDLDYDTADGDTIHPEGFRLVGVKSVEERIDELKQSYESFYGREIQLNKLHQDLQQVVFDQMLRATLIEGEQGIGKSTLIEEFLSGINPNDIRVVRTVMRPVDADAPFSGLANVLASLLRIRDLEDVREVRETLETRVQAFFRHEKEAEQTMLLHSLGAVLDLQYRGGRFEQLAGAERRSRMFLSVRRLLERYAAEIPILLAVEDVENFDSVTRAFFTDYLDSERQLPIYCLLTVRSGEEFEQETATKLRALDVVDRVELNELGRSDAEDLARNLLRIHRVRDEKLVDDIVDHAGGNPMFIKEMIAVLRDRGLLAQPREKRSPIFEHGAPQWLPSNVEGLVNSRIDRLDAGLKNVLRRVSLLWTPFTLEDAKLVVDGDQLSDAVEELEQLDFLDRVEEDGGYREADGASDAENGRYHFANKVTKKVATQKLLDTTAKKLHRRIARHLRDSEHRVGVATYPRIALHFEKAGDDDQAISFYLEAAEEALDRRGAAEALRLCDKILDQHRSTCSPNQIMRTLKCRERALKELGKTEARKESLDELEALVENSGDEADCLDIDLRMANFYYDNDQLSDANAYLENVLERADQLDKPVFESRGRALEGRIRLDQGDKEEALKHLNRAIETLETAVEAGTNADHSEREMIRYLASAYKARGVCYRQAGDDDKAIRDYQQGLDYAEGVALPRLERHMRGNLGLVYIYLGQFGRAIEAFETLLEACEKLGYRRDKALTLINLGHAYQLLGDVEKAKSLIRRGVYLARKIGARKFVADGQIALGYCCLDSGDLDAGQNALHEGLRIADSIPSAYLGIHATLGLAKLRLATGEARKAKTALMQAQDAVERSEEARMWWGASMGDSLKGRALGALGRRDEAIESSSRAVELVEGERMFWKEEILYRHAQLLPDSDAYRQKRRSAIERARGIVQSRLEKLPRQDLRQIYSQKDLNRSILNTAELLID